MVRQKLVVYGLAALVLILSLTGCNTQTAEKTSAEAFSRAVSHSDRGKNAGVQGAQASAQQNATPASSSSAGSEAANGKDTSSIYAAGTVVRQVTKKVHAPAQTRATVSSTTHTDAVSASSVKSAVTVQAAPSVSPPPAGELKYEEKTFDIHHNQASHASVITSWEDLSPLYSRYKREDLPYADNIFETNTLLRIEYGLPDPSYKMNLRGVSINDAGECIIELEKEHLVGDFVVPCVSVPQWKILKLRKGALDGVTGFTIQIAETTTDLTGRK